MSVESPDESLTFVDSNVWLYALIAAQEPAKSAVAKQIISSPRFVSVQVVNEVCVNLLKKAQRSEDELAAVIRAFHSQHHVVEVTEDVLLRAVELRKSGSFSFWDSLILAAALSVGATVLYTEDMQHGLTVDGTLLIVNPILGS